MTATMPGNSVGRPLSPRERELIERLVRAALPEASELLAQISNALALGDCPFISIEVAPASPSATLARKGVVEARNLDFESDTAWTHILLWIEDGRLSGLELSWVSDNPPEEWPHPNEADVTFEPGLSPAQRLQTAQNRWVISWPMLIAVTVGVLAGFVAAAPLLCEDPTRCQPLLFRWVPFLEDVSFPSDLARGRAAGALGLIGAILGGWIASRIVRAFRN
ncbi:MAG: hypothetical protein ABR505_04910 [Actinomycetota bacterium]